MTASEHVLILLSLIISLGLAHLLNGIARLIHAKDIQWSWLHGVWIIFILLLFIDFWISVWQLRLETDWNIWMVGFWVTMATLLYLVAALAVPDKIPDRGMDLGAFHDVNRKRYLGLWIFAMTFAFAANLMLEGFAGANVIVILNVLCLVAAGFGRPLWLQWAGTLGTGTLFAVYFALFMADF